MYRTLPLLLPVLLLAAGPAGAAGVRLPVRVPALPVVAPAEVRLSGPDARQQLIVTEVTRDGLSVDRTGAARFTSTQPRVVRVGAGGVVTPVADGVGSIRVEVSGRARDVPVRVSGAAAERSFNFLNDITPVLSDAGCNQGACHGKAEGQAGFKLSVFGYDPEADYAQILHVARGRRVAKADPARSLFLLKPTGAVPHAGGVRFPVNSPEYQTLVQWLAAGAPFGSAADRRLVRITVSPGEIVSAPQDEHRLLLTAHYSDGTARDVTTASRYQSNDPVLATVTDEGRVRALGLPGEAAIMAQYGGQVAVSRLVMPRPDRTPLPAMPAPRNLVDGLVWDRLKKLRIAPSSGATDAEFLRRAYLDTIGLLPTPDEARAFLQECDQENARSARSAGTSPPAAYEARQRLVGRLLERPEFADFWAMRWADLLRVNKDRLGAKGAHAFYSWIRASIAEHQPYDRFVNELVAASGNSSQNGAANFYRVLTKPEELAASISQVFLGTRIECAQCHHHPFEKWSQDDYYGLVGYFTRVKSKGLGPTAALVTAGDSGDAVNPRTKAVVPPRPLGGPLGPPVEDADRRRQLAAWMTRPDNPYLARVMVNRLWAHFMGRGLVEPVDDFRDTNPPSNPALLDTLARRLVADRFDLRQTIRLILNSQVYQTSGKSNPTNVRDLQNYSRAYPKRLQAEVLLDAIAAATGSAVEFPGLPRGVRAVQVWDSEYSLQWQSYFLNAFGRPPRTSPCECERSMEPTIAQVLHLMNAPEIQRQLSDRTGRARSLALSERTPAQIVEELFLAAYARYPTRREAASALEAFRRTPDRVQATEDILWALLNTLEFAFNH